MCATQIDNYAYSRFNTHEEACKAGVFVPKVIYDNPVPQDGSWSCDKYANTSAGSVSSCPPPEVTGDSSSVGESPSSQTSSSTTDAPSLPPTLSGTAFRNKISGNSLSSGTIVGIVVGTTAIIGILLGCIWFIRRLRRRETVKSMKARTADLQPPPADTATVFSRSERKAAAYRSWSFMPLLQNRASSPVTMTDGHTMIRFSPDLMVRQPNEPLPTSRCLRPVPYDAWDTKSLDSMRTGSRVELPLDASNDPNIPIQPLRYGSKKEEL
ncbi:hypothetical protein BD413DRAFT_528885 [Trametes elegans]|nr:hypothetical protein BD413DRAFT_528885 [Trametes elegans]